MRGRAIGLGLLGLGAFLLAGALATRLFLVPALVILPSDQKADPVALGTGVDFFDLGAQKQLTGLDVTVHQHVLGHPSAAGASSDVAVWEFGSTMIDGNGTRIQYGTYQVCIDRHTALAVSCPSAFVSDASGAKVTNAAIHGLTLTFPFHTAKTTYQVFDSTTTKAFPAHYAGTETLQGLQVYRFEQTVPETVLESTDVPGAMAGAPDQASVKADIVYSNTRTWWVEPTSGVIVNAAEHPVTVFRGPDGTTGATFLSGTFTGDAATVRIGHDRAVTSRDQINLITTVVPLTLFGLGLLAVIGGVLLVRRNRADEDGPATADDRRTLEPQVQ
jgi:hypothetical protein